MYKFNAKKTLAVVTAWPDLAVAPQLIAWFHAQGVGRIEAHRLGDGRIDCAYNNAVKIALESSSDQFIFADKDIWPGPPAAAFLKSRADVVGAEYDTGRPKSWATPDSIHTGLWRTRRAVLERIAAGGLFVWELNDDKTDAPKCLCDRLRRRALAAGFTVEHAGRVDHIPRPRSPVNRVRLSNL